MYKLFDSIATDRMSGYIASPPPTATAPPPTAAPPPSRRRHAAAAPPTGAAFFSFSRVDGAPPAGGPPALHRLLRLRYASVSCPGLLSYELCL